MIYMIGDCHFCHARILELCNRPFTNVNEMNEALIKNYNDVIKPDDEVYFFGDVAWKDVNKAIYILTVRLNPSKKYLLIGNHDHKNLKDGRFLACFEWAKDYYELTYNSRLYVLSHYPLASWRSSGHGSIMVHGHCHNRLNSEKYLRFDCGVDNPICSFAPINIEKLESLMKIKQDKLKKLGSEEF